SGMDADEKGERGRFALQKNSLSAAVGSLGRSRPHLRVGESPTAVDRRALRYGNLGVAPRSAAGRHLARIALRFERTRNDQGDNDEESAGIHLGHDHLRADPDRRAVLGGAGSAALREALFMDYVPALARWVHFLAGVMWIGLLYYFNFVQVPALKAAAADGTTAGITKHAAPRSSPRART